VAHGAKFKEREEKKFEKMGKQVGKALA